MKQHISPIRIFCFMMLLVLALGCKKKEDDTPAPSNNGSTGNGGSGGSGGSSLTLGSNSPVTIGTTLYLTASAVSGATYSWTGPAGFAASAQNPSRANFTNAFAGTYYCSTTVGYYPGPSSSIVVAAK